MGLLSGVRRQLRTHTSLGKNGRLCFAFDLALVLRFMLVDLTEVGAAKIGWGCWRVQSCTFVCGALCVRRTSLWQNAATLLSTQLLKVLCDLLLFLFSGVHLFVAKRRRVCLDYFWVVIRL